MKSVVIDFLNTGVIHKELVSPGWTVNVNDVQATRGGHGAEVARQMPRGQTGCSVMTMHLCALL